MKKLKLKKTTLTTVITIIAIVIAYFVMNTLNNSGVLSNVMSGLLVRICVWSIMAVSLNLVVGILGELSLGHAGFMYVGAFTGSLFTQITADMISNDLLRFVIGILKISSNRCIKALKSKLCFIRIVRMVIVCA